MIRVKAHSLILILSVVASAVSGASAGAVDLDGWTTYGATNQVSYLAEVEGEVWALTGGGIVIIDPDDFSVKMLTNVDNLLTNSFTHLAQDSAGDVWIAGLGWLNRRNAEATANQFTSYAFLDDNKDRVTLSALADDDQFLWLATSLGLVLFSKTIDGGQIQDSYQRFGSLPAGTAVKDVAVWSDSIVIATADGVAVANRGDFAQLKSSASWASFAVDDFSELVGSQVTSVSRLDSFMVIGTNDGAFALYYNATDTTLQELALPAGTSVNRMRSDGFSLTIHTSRGEYNYDGSTVTSLTGAGLPTTAVTSGVTVAGIRFVGTGANGVFAMVDGAFEKIETGAIPFALARDISISAPGVPLAAFHTGGFARLQSSGWETLEVNSAYWAISVAADSSGALWLGTFGGGVWRVTDSDTTRFDSLNSTLKGNTDFGINNFVVIPEIVSSPRYTFLANFRAHNLKPVSIVDQLNPSRWISFGLAEGVDDELITSLDIFGSTLVVSSENKGVYFCNLGFDPFDLSDYRVTHYSEDASDPFLRLPSDRVNVVRFDSHGNAWVGHAFGLAKFDEGIERFIEVTLPLGLGPEVVDIVLDPQQNLWLATATGLGRFCPADGEFIVYTPLNSGLVSSAVQALAFDASTNYLWIATDNGVSRLQADIGQPNFALLEVTAYPNPFVISSGVDILHFNFSGVAQARIFTETAELVWTGSSVQGWDGRNLAGEPVASGIYLFVLAVEGESDVRLGKFVLIRN